MHYIYEYAAFLAKAVTILAVILVVLLTIISARRSKITDQGELQVTSFNEHLEDLSDSILAEVLDKASYKEKIKQQEKNEKQLKKAGTSNELPRVFVLDFDGDIKASDTAGLRESITAVLQVAKTTDEVVVRLESAGGMVHSYGLAASQLARIRQAEIPLTICVDKVAASGGYMMACIGNRILSAPFAILGSIGVVAQVPNVHRLLKKHDIDVDVITAGKYKRTVTVLGENTEEGKQKFQQELETTHQLFKRFVADYRPQLNIEEVATGETWLGIDALNKQLIDSVMTSDEYLVKQAQSKSVYILSYTQKQKMAQKLGFAVSHTVEAVIGKVWKLAREQRSGQ